MSVNNKIEPAHYRRHPSGVECITIAEQMNFNRGNAVKYIWRAGERPESNSIEDLAKARWYIDREIERLEQAARSDAVNACLANTAFHIDLEEFERMTATADRGQTDDVEG